MAKARVRLKGLNSTLRTLTSEVGKLRGKGATPSAERELRALHKKLTTVRRMMASECPDTQFRSFDVASAAGRKRTRKVR